MKIFYCFTLLLSCDYLFATTINTASSTVTQAIGNITPGSFNQPIMRIKIVTAGGGANASICSMQFTMKNTVDADVSSAKLFYTGTSYTFATTTQLGTTVTNPTGTITFSFTQSHGNATFYYWLAFDIVNCVPDCRFFDALIPTNGISYVNASTICTGTSTFTPIDPDPTGFNKTYCECSDCWNRKTDFGGTARDGAIGFTIGTSCYIGIGGTGLGKIDFWEWNQTTNLWTQKADFGGTSRHDAVGFSIGTKGYIGTGGTGGSVDFWEWDQSTNIWTQKTNFGGVARTNAVGFSIGAKGYIGTGYDGFSGLKDFWEWDQTTNLWTQIADFGGGERINAVGFSISNKGYIGTGLFNATYKQDFWEWDQSTNVWVQKADYPQLTSEAVGFSIGSKGYIGLGDNTNSNVFWEWDPSTNVWTQRSYFQGTGRWNAVGISIGDKGYVGTGYDGTYFKDFWEYTVTGSASSNSITTSAISPTSICQGGSITVNYTALGTYYSGNVFTVQLSDVTGSFSSPTDIGNVTATANTPISATIPTAQPLGTLYRIRVIASCPSIIGSDNGADLTITSCVSNFYWVGGNGNWNDASHWSTSSGGAGGAGIPDINTNVYIDNNSGTVTITMPAGTWYTKNFTMSGAGAKSPIVGQGSLLPRP